MALSTDKVDFNPLTERVKNSWETDESIQCESKSLKVSSSDSEEVEEDSKDMTLKTYQQTIMANEPGDIQKLEENVFPLSPSTVGSRSPPPYPTYGDSFQQDGYYENRYSGVNNVGSGISSYSANNQLAVSQNFLTQTKFIALFSINSNFMSYYIYYTVY